jgi:hypothetical protein
MGVGSTRICDARGVKEKFDEPSAYIQGAFQALARGPLDEPKAMVGNTTRARGIQPTVR